MTQTTPPVDVLAGWQRGTYVARGISHDVYRRGSGPGVIVIHEIPGITPAVARFANEVVDAGFSVTMPLLVGEAGREVSVGYSLRSISKVCVAKEFTNWATGVTSPVIEWLRDLAESIHAECGGAGVGAVGMCFSGGFALGMMVSPSVVAPVLSQPSMPFAVGRRRSADLGVSSADLAVARARAQHGCDVMGVRFTGDRLVGSRFATLRAEFGEHFLAVELPSEHVTDHSVLTEQRDDSAVKAVLDFFRTRLLAH